ncbi:hypothetical protein [Chlamydia caviae]|uniref:Uncharacterized protein n=1 Tax=Chlamydia caviae (strain ATCC VR-813 / DSM 19441 / 03DC25 / GPIC) TaxID=227941 RepID=Q822Y0_CHLCV|nr:hypothetical protein [Chlamydia caviae]AAP05289.1 conserved hypothetical protein [Chlamydia caviae GPIC]
MRKRNSFLNPTANNKSNRNEPLASMIQKTITMVERIKGNSQDLVDLDIHKIHADIQGIKTVLMKHAEDIDSLNTKTTEEKVQALEADTRLMKLSLQSLLEELRELKTLIGEGIDESINDQSYLVRDVLIEIYEKFLPLSGGRLLGDIDMNNHTISGLETPKNPRDSHAASVGYVGKQLSPILDKLNETYEKTKRHDKAITGFNFQVMPVSGGKFRGIVDMDGYRITGLANPEERSDAISLGYLERYLEHRALPEEAKETLLSPQITRMETNLLYSTGLSHKVDYPLPLEILSQGILGFTWETKSSTLSGKFPLNSLKHTFSNEERRCFVLDDNVLYGKYSGIYTWELTLKALIPSVLECRAPSVKLRACYDYPSWNHKEELQSSTSYIEIPLYSVGTMMVGGHSYDIVELSPGNSQVFTVPKNCGGVALYLENHKEGACPQDLYVVQAAYSCSWRQY